MPDEEQQIFDETESKHITLDFDGSLVTPDDFKKAVNAFIDLLTEVTDQVSGGGEKVKWNIKVAEGSRLLIAQAVADAKTQANATKTINAIYTGIRLLEKGAETQPHFFTERALKAARDLAALQDPKGKKIRYVRLRLGPDSRSEISTKALEHIDKLMGEQHQALGSVEGRLQTISERGTLQFVVYDSLFDKGINCFIENNMASEAIGAFGKRVAVSGIIQYDRENRPVIIKVDFIRPLKEAKDLPPIKSLRGIFNRAG